MNPQPCAFMSHASADKPRIVRPLDSGLRGRGVRTWLDERDLLPGDKLVDKIFREGITESDVFIVILSKHSIGSRWLREELDAAVVHRISGIVKSIIPVVLDGVTPPPQLAATVWERVTDLTNLDPHIDRIARAIFGSRSAPVASPPPYVAQPVHGIPGLTQADEVIFTLMADAILDPENDHPYVDVEALISQAAERGLTEEQVIIALKVLEQRAYLDDVIHGLGRRHPLAARLSAYAIDTYLTTYRPQAYADAQRAVIVAIVNQGAHSDRDLMRKPAFLTDSFTT